jgi:hypothetical protein
MECRKRILRDDDNQRLLNGIGSQNDRGHLLRFLYHPGVQRTNNRAERILHRPEGFALFEKPARRGKSARSTESISDFA